MGVFYPVIISGEDREDLSSPILGSIAWPSMAPEVQALQIKEVQEGQMLKQDGLPGGWHI